MRTLFNSYLVSREAYLASRLSTEFAEHAKTSNIVIPAKVGYHVGYPTVAGTHFLSLLFSSFLCVLGVLCG